MTSLPKSPSEAPSFEIDLEYGYTKYRDAVIFSIGTDPGYISHLVYFTDTGRIWTSIPINLTGERKARDPAPEELAAIMAALLVSHCNDQFNTSYRYYWEK